MDLHALLFHDSGPNYRRMAAALAESVRSNSPATPLTFHTPEPDPEPPLNLRGIPLGQRFNSRKTKHLARLVADAPDGALLGFLDCDTCVLRDLSAIYKQSAFDLAITYRPSWAKLPYNTGVLFVVVNDRTRAFFAAWWEANECLLASAALRSRWMRKYGGINQASLGMLLEADEYDLGIQPLDCCEWNCCAECWDSFDERTRIIHLVTNLRAACVGNARLASGRVRELADIWAQYDLQGAAV